MIREYYDVELHVENIGVIVARLYRFHSPLTLSRLVSKLPLSSIMYNAGNKFLYILCDLGIGREGRIPHTKVKEGQLAYWPLRKYIVIALQEMTLTPSCNVLGEIIEGKELLRNIPGSVRVTVRLR
ncbi:MAG: hypothetical protein DRJ40_07025 [Thermoprotei archaeon]|nr:MAG: hypothetical protein DRJ40_07025 [Thermoprotei archaeon]